MRFRLLNSEIGNDQTEENKNEVSRRIGFRLLNSEIGNDREDYRIISLNNYCFRLLNSEIGNDHGKNNQLLRYYQRFSSP